MNVGSLFSGIGGMDHGLHVAGHTHRWFCESDPWRRSVLAHHWPGVPIYHDLRAVADNGSRSHEVNGTWRDDGPLEQGRASTGRDGSIDLLCGGFPCQDLSVAGQRRGLAGARSGLFSGFARIIDVVRPRWVLIENVPGLLSSNGGRDFGIVLGTLADLGYGVAWRILDSRYFGVPQRRRRVFIVGALSDGDPRAAAQRAGQVLAVGTRCPGHPPARTQTGSDVAVASALGTGNGGAGGWRIGDEEAAGNQVVSYALNAKKGYRDGDADTNYVSFDAEMSYNGGGEHAYLTRKLRRAIQSEATGFRRLTPTECERLQALPDSWTDYGPDSRRYAALGDAVTSSVSEWIGRRLQ